MKSKRARPPVSPPKKPPPEARGPDRAWSGAWSGAGRDEPRFRATRGTQSVPDSERNGAKGANGVSEGVALGYRVIQEYLRQGERVARSLWNFGEDEADRHDPARLVDRALRSAQDLAGAFSEMVRALAKDAPLPSDGRPPGAFDFDPPRRRTHHGQDEGDETAPGRSGRQQSRPTVALSVRSHSPVNMALKLAEASGARAFRVPPLARTGAGRMRLGGISIATGQDGKGVAITLAVPPRLAKGRYQGPVLDARTGRPVGFLSVDVGAG